VRGIDGEGVDVQSRVQRRRGDEARRPAVFGLADEQQPARKRPPKRLLRRERAL